jgi:hypothetical protein
VQRDGARDCGLVVRFARTFDHDGTAWAACIWLSRAATGLRLLPASHQGKGARPGLPGKSSGHGVPISNLVIFASTVTSTLVGSPGHDLVSSVFSALVCLCPLPINTSAESMFRNFHGSGSRDCPM